MNVNNLYKTTLTPNTINKCIKEYCVSYRQSRLDHALAQATRLVFFYCRAIKGSTLVNKRLECG